MFEVGKTYTFRIMQDGDEWQQTWRVDAIDGPLLQLYSSHEQMIFNTHSPAFLSAKETAVDWDKPNPFDKLLKG